MRQITYHTARQELITGKVSCRPYPTSFGLMRRWKAKVGVLYDLPLYILIAKVTARYMKTLNRNLSLSHRKKRRNSFLVLLSIVLRMRYNELYGTKSSITLPLQSHRLLFIIDTQLSRTMPAYIPLVQIPAQAPRYTPSLLRQTISPAYHMIPTLFCLLLRNHHLHRQLRSTSGRLD